MILTLTISRKRLAYAALGVCAIALLAGRQWMSAAQSTTDIADNLTPGMLFGPLYLGDGQHIELCASYLSPTGIKATVHFRNLTTGEVTVGQQVTLPTGGGACVNYQGKGLVVGMARGDGAASDCVSPSNALISTMSVIEDNLPLGNGAYRTSIKATVQGVAKIWVKGL